MMRILCLLLVAVVVQTADPKCGVKTVNRMSDRIIGGRNALPMEWPWQVSLQKRDRSQKYPYQCGGTLVNSQWVLSAAHCTFYSKDPLKWRIVLGNLHLKEKDSTGKEVYPSKVIIHENWRGETGLLYDDIALFKLEKPVDFNVDKHLVPICLAKSGLDVENMTCTTTGWGAIRDGTQPNILQVVDGKIVSNTNCAKIYHSINNITDSMICAGGEEGKGPCNGDSGGPLQCKINNQWMQVGVVSFSKSCAHQYPTVHTRVSKYIDWITKHIKDN